MVLLENMIDPLLGISAVGSILLFTLLYFVVDAFREKRESTDVRKRLSIDTSATVLPAGSKKNDANKTNKNIANNVAKRAKAFYSASDPEAIRKLQMRMLQAGILTPGAVGYFLAARFGMALIGGAMAALVLSTMFADSSLTTKFCLGLGLVAVGYFLPNFYLNQRISQMETENRQGFPDILDLMVVSAQAGLTMEASIERISQEIQTTYPNLSAQLNMTALEIRAGRPIDQALRSFGERLKLEEVQGFATMVQQSKELGTSVSDALRVYSDEMRHKRMMKAEEKAYALPAKMSIPVTVFILPIVIGVAVIPTIVRLAGFE